MFGNSAWGQNNQQQPQQNTGGGLFGGGSTFGQQQNTGFGQAATTGGFGQPQQQQNTGGGLFGASANTGGGFGSGGFGTNTASTSTFGARPTFGATGSTPFGGTATTSGGGLFGSSNTNTTNAFGATNTASTGGLFGSRPSGFGTTTSTFGSGSTGGFGAASTQANQPSNQVHMYNNNPPPPIPQTGTAQPPYQPTWQRDPAQGLGKEMPAHLFHVITAMEPYRGGSFEELRMLDYQQGRKEPTAQPAQPAATGFGQASGGFGATTSGFGQPAASTSTFGAPKPGGLFGSTGTTTGGFGSTSGGFGAQTNTGGGLFGQTNTATTGFGAQNTNTGGGLFGQTQQQPQNTGGGLFGNSNPFGQNQQQQQPATTGFGSFGAAANKPAFGATTTGFGTGSGTSTFGQTNTTGTTTGFGGFGQQQQQQPAQNTGGGLFGSGSGGFGQTNTQTNTGGGLFGQQNNQQQQSGGLFGNTAAAKPGGLFGSTPATGTTSGFGGFGQTNTNTTQPTTSLFGQTNTATNTGGGLFGQQQQAQPAATGGGLFGNTSTANAGGGLFGAKPATTTGGLFGSTPAQPAQTTTTGFGGFGQPAATTNTGGGLFGSNTASTAPKPSLFGGGGGLFGQQQQQQPAANTGGGLFGSLGQSTTTAQPTTSLFGSAQPAQQQSTLGQSGGLFGSTLGQSTFNNQQQQQPSLTASVDQNPYGRNDLFQYSGQKLELGSSTKKPALPPLTASAYRPSPSKGNRLAKLRGFATSSVNGSTTSPKLSSPIPSSSRTSSLIGSPVVTERYMGLTDAALSPNAFIPRPSVKKITVAPGRTTLNGRGEDPLESVLGKSGLRSSANGSSVAPTPDFSPRSPGPLASSSRQAIEDTPTRRPAQMEVSLSNAGTSARPLQKGDYWCRPKLEKLKTMDHDQLRSLPNFTVGRKEYGEVTFLEPVDLTSLPSLNDLLGGIIVFDSLELTVYPDETDKPPRGKGLNVPAEVSLENVWARDKATRQPVTDPNDLRYKRQLKRIQAVPETEFIGFKDGVWTFRVEHFSRYGLDASDDETDEDEGVDSASPNKSKSLPEKSPSVYSDEDVDGFPPTKSLYDMDASSDQHDSGSEDTEMSYDDEDDMMDSGAEYEDEYEDEPDAYRAIKSKLGAQGMQRLREMQSAFFGAQETKSKRPTLAEQKANEIRQALERKRAEAGFEIAEEGVARLDDRAVKRASFGESSRPPQLRQPRKYAKVPLDQSFVAGNEGVRPDAGLALGRSFRCSWGPNGELVHMGKICSPTTEFESSPDAVVYVQQVALLAESQAVERARADRLLSLLLEYTEVDVNEDKVPEAITNTDIRFKDFAKLFDSSDRSHEANLWRLGQALFDEVDLKLSPSTPEDISSRVAEMRRKLALSKWLEDAVAPAMDADLAKAGDDRPAKVFALLTGNRIDRAMQSALDGNDLRLATLVSQAGSTDEFRAEVRRQLEDWTKYKTNSLIGYTYRKIYALLSGIPNVSKGNPERGADHAPDVIVNENLDWKRAFGLYLWHACPFELGVADVLQYYTEALSSSHPPSKPLPPYLEQPDARNRWEMPTEPTDVLFNLIKMYADRTISLEEVVTSRDCGASPTDVRLPWHISFLLSQALQKRDFADREEADGSGIRYSATANRMTESYAAQLEEEGQWTWAAYVLLHLAYADSRRAALKALLFRHPEPTPIEQIFLVDKLRIPREWLHEARAAHLASQGNAYSEYRDLIPAGLADRAQRTLVTKLAPEAVLRDDPDLLLHLCKELEPLRPEGWEYGGKLFLDYLNIRERTTPLLAAARRSGAHPDPREAAELRALAENIPRVLQLLPSLFPDRTDVRQVASLAGMLGTLQAFASDMHCAGYMPRPPVSDLLLDKDRLHLLQESATESFDKSLRALVA